MSTSQKVVFTSMAQAFAHPEIAGEANALAILARHVTSKVRDKQKRDAVSAALDAVGGVDGLLALIAQQKNATAKK